MKREKIKLSEVIKKLKSIGYKIEKGPNKKYCIYFNVYPGYGEKFKETERDLYKLYKIIFIKGDTGNSIVKSLTDGVDRAYVRDAIKTERYDDLPLNKRAKEVDPWGYD